MSTEPPAGQSEVGHENGADRGLYGWSPPRLPADTPAKRWVDRVLPTAAVPVTVYFAAMVGLLALAGSLPDRPGLVIDGIAAVSGGLWCSGNFWRCRHAHCIVTGVGWLALAAFIFVEAGIGHSLISGFEQTLLLAVLVAGLLFEAYWKARHGTNQVVRTQPQN